MDNFITHGFEQLLRFTQVKEWDDLSEERKVQLGFNMGVVAHGLNLNKEDGFQYLSDLQNGVITVQVFRKHIESLVGLNNIQVSKENISKPF